LFLASVFYSITTVTVWGFRIVLQSKVATNVNLHERNNYVHLQSGSTGDLFSYDTRW